MSPQADSFVLVGATEQHCSRSDREGQIFGVVVRLSPGLLTFHVTVPGAHSVLTVLTVPAFST